MFDFLNDLDEYFCEKYENYDKICVIEGYRMPKMQTSEVREDGRTYAYTLPANTMRLALQENKADILKKLKSQLLDKTFSFSFRPLGFFERCKNRISRYGAVKTLAGIFSRNHLTSADALAELDVAPEIWKGIVKGKFLPSKNLVFSLALTAQISKEDVDLLMLSCGYEWDYTIVKDVVVCYLLEQKVYNREMIDVALAEYKVSNLFIRQEK